MTALFLTAWQTPPTTLQLDRQTVHLWRFRLDLPVAEIAALRQLLSSEEQLRAERLLDRLKTEAFIAARGRLRQILARYLKLEPGVIGFIYGKHGKPRLTSRSDNHLAFNLTHAGHWGLLAVTETTEVGVDIEKIDRQLDYQQLATNFFSADEAAALEQYSPARRRRAFYRLWTRKEAELKRAGCGFSMPRMNRQNNAGQIRSFTVAQGYLGNVAVAEAIAIVQLWSLNGVNP